MIIACVNYVLTGVVMPYPQVLEVAQGPPGGHDEGVDAAPVEGHPGQAPDVALLRVPGHDELDLGLAGRLALGPRQHWHGGSHIMQNYLLELQTTHRQSFHNHEEGPYYIKGPSPG